VEAGNFKVIVTLPPLADDTCLRDLLPRRRAPSRSLVGAAVEGAALAEPREQTTSMSA